MTNVFSSDKSTSVKLGEVLNYWRRIDGRSLRDVAAEIGIGVATLSRIERGQSMDGETIVRLFVWLFKRGAK